VWHYVWGTGVFLWRQPPSAPKGAEPHRFQKFWSSCVLAHSMRNKKNQIKFGFCFSCYVRARRSSKISGNDGAPPPWERRVAVAIEIRKSPHVMLHQISCKIFARWSNYTWVWYDILRFKEEKCVFHCRPWMMAHDCLR